MCNAYLLLPAPIPGIKPLSTTRSCAKDTARSTTSSLQHPQPHENKDNDKGVTVCG